MVTGEAQGAQADRLWGLFTTCLKREICVAQLRSYIATGRPNVPLTYSLCSVCSILLELARPTRITAGRNATSSIVTQMHSAQRISCVRDVALMCKWTYRMKPFVSHFQSLGASHYYPALKVFISHSDCALILLLPFKKGALNYLAFTRAGRREYGECNVIT